MKGLGKEGILSVMEEKVETGGGFMEKLSQFWFNIWEFFSFMSVQTDFRKNPDF